MICLQDAHRQSLMSKDFFLFYVCVYLFGQAASRVGEGVLRAEDVADCVSRELMGASRRSEFGSAMRKTRAWMLAGPA